MVSEAHPPPVKRNSKLPKLTPKQIHVMVGVDKVQVKDRVPNLPNDHFPVLDCFLFLPTRSVRSVSLSFGLTSFSWLRCYHLDHR